MATRVLWVVKGLGPGGAETLLAASAAVHDRLRFSIECAYVLPFKDHMAARLEEHGVRTLCVSNTQRDLLWPFRLSRLIRTGDYDVVHVHSPLPGSVARLAVRLMRQRRPRLVTTEHNSWNSFSWPTRWANRLTSRWNAVTFAVTEETRRSIRGRSAAVATSLEHGIDVAATAALGQRRNEVREELGIDNDRLVIGTVANFRVQKDYPTLLAAVRRSRDLGLDAVWVLVGQGPLEQEMRSQAREMGLGECVIFTGFRDDATRVMASFDIFTLASSWEGLPVALMEALALGLPVAATAVGGVAESLEDGSSALLVAAGDSDALASSWIRVASDASLRDRLSAAARNQSQRFDIRRAQRSVEESYAGLTGGQLAVANESSGSRASSARGHSENEGVEIRRATAADRQSILALFSRSLGWTDDPRFEDLYEWKHEANPFGVSPAWVAVHEHDVVAARLFMQWRFKRGDKVLRAVRAVDTATLPEFRGRGLFTTLTLAAIDELTAAGLDFVFNTPNQQSLPGYLKMGWREVGRLQAHVWPSGPTGLMRAAQSRVPAEIWSESVEVGEPALQWFRASGDWPQAEGPGPRAIATDRSMEFLEWRYGLSSLGYRAALFPGGAVIFRIRRRGKCRELVVADILGTDLRAARRAIRSAVRAASADYAITLSSSRWSAGSVPLPGAGPMLTWRPLAAFGMPPLPNWSVGLGDIELF